MIVFAVIAVLASAQTAQSGGVRDLPAPSLPPPTVERAPYIWTVPTPPPTLGSVAPILSPEEAVMRAADAAPVGVAGQFGLRIEGVGMQGPWLFLNSQADYRDQRTLTLAIAPEVQSVLRRRFGSDLMTALGGRHILVSGIARRVRIDFTVGGRPSGKFYYQTHVRVSDARQIVTIN